MPLVIAAIWAFFSRMMATNLGKWIVQALLFMGLSYGSNEIIVQPVIDQLINLTVTNSAQVSALVSFFNFDKLISMVTSAYLIKVGMQSTQTFLKRAA